jgi:hypothetical protein
MSGLSIHKHSTDLLSSTDMYFAAYKPCPNVLTRNEWLELAPRLAVRVVGVLPTTPAAQQKLACSQAEFGHNIFSR